MSDDSQRPIIVKKIKKGGHGHHGGAWKIAYADFVTAMMAFFLLMWLLNAVSKDKLGGISEYFKTPLKVALMGGPSSGSENTILKGGGVDVARNPGDARKGQSGENNKVNAKREEEKQKLSKLKEKVEKAMESNPTLKPFSKQLMLDITSEGLRIQIVDEQNRPMFGSGSDKLQPYTKDILRELGQILNEVPNRISLSGHTDAVNYGDGKGYGNWELSTNRANAARRELVTGGMSDEKTFRVVGLGSAAPLDKDNPVNPINRRISIIVMNKETEASLLKEAGKEVNVDPEPPAKPTAAAH